MGSLLGGLGAVLESFGTILGPSGAVLELLARLSEPFGRPLEASHVQGPDERWLLPSFIGSHLAAPIDPKRHPKRSKISPRRSSRRPSTGARFGLYPGSLLDIPNWAKSVAQKPLLSNKRSKTTQDGPRTFQDRPRQPKKPPKPPETYHKRIPRPPMTPLKNPHSL